MYPQQNQAGSALVVALLIVSIVAAIAATLASRMQVEVKRTTLLLSADRIQLASMYSLSWAMTTPLEDKDKNLILPLDMPPHQIQDFNLKATLSSAQGRFNLNNLTKTEYIPIFTKLIQITSPLVSDLQSRELAEETAYFIGNKPDPKRDESYLALKPGYYPSHKLFLTPTELRLVKGMTAEIYQAVLPYVTALPSVTPLDPRAASKPVLVSYGMTEKAADQILNYSLSQKSFNDVNAYFSEVGLEPGQASLNLSLLSLKTDYFLLTTTIQSQKDSWKLYSLLNRTKSSDKLQVFQRNIDIYEK